MTVRSRGRRGVALVIVLALLALAAALVMGTFSAGRAMVRAVVTARAVARADAEARRALARALADWQPSLDSLPVGAAMIRALPAHDSASPPLLVDARVQRLGGGIYLVLADVRVVNRSAVLARRRYRLLVEKPSGADTLRPVVTPSRVAGWSLDETN